MTITLRSLAQNTLQGPTGPVGAQGPTGSVGVTGPSGVSPNLPKISNLEITNSSYTVLDDTAVDVNGGYIKLTGSGFVTGCQLLINTVAATSTTFISSTEVVAQVPAMAAGSYVIYLTNPDGGVAIHVAGLTYSTSPTWTTASSLPDAVSTISYTQNLVATGAASYSVDTGSSLPSGMSLASGGTLSGTVVVANNTAYSFTILATDTELQDSPRTFSLNVLARPQGAELLGSLSVSNGFGINGFDYDGNDISGADNWWAVMSVGSNGSASTLFRSTTNGASWTTVNSNLPQAGNYNNTEQIVAFSANELVLTNKGGVYYSTNQGSSWTQKWVHGSGGQNNISGPAFNRTTKNMIWTGYYSSSNAYSTDGSVTIGTQVSDGAGPRMVLAYTGTVSGADKFIMMPGGSSGSPSTLIYDSNINLAGGTTITAPGGINGWGGVSANPNNGRVVAYVNSTYYVSTNRGATWSAAYNVGRSISGGVLAYDDIFYFFSTTATKGIYKVSWTDTTPTLVTSDVTAGATYMNFRYRPDLNLLFGMEDTGKLFRIWS